MKFCVAWSFTLLAVLASTRPLVDQAVAQNRSGPDCIDIALPDTLSEIDLPFGAGTSYLLGTTLLEQGDFQGALPYLYHAYRLGSDMPEIADAYLSVLLALGYREDALKVVEARITAEPGNLPLRHRKIALLSELRRYGEALAEVAALRAAGDDSVDLLLVEAGLFAHEGRSDEALSAYRRALSAGENEPEKVYLLMANLLEQTGRAQALADLWEEAVANVPESRPLRFGLLRQLVRDGRIDDAHRLVQEANEVEASLQEEGGREAATRVVAWELELVDLLVQTGRIQEAVDFLTARRERGEANLEASLWLSRLLVRSDRIADAIRLMREVVEQWPESARAHYYLGDLLANSGELSAGETELREAHRLRPREPDYLVSLVRLLTVKHATVLQQKRADESTTAAREEIGNLARAASTLINAEDHRSQMVLGYAFRAVADLERAQEQFDAAADGKMFRKEALLQLAICQIDMGDRLQAEHTLETLWHEFPGDPVIANSLGYFLADRGVELERAERLIRQALEDDPENGAYLDSLGWVLYRQGLYQAAFDQLVIAANAMPDDATILEHLGLILLALDQTAEALRVLERALEVGGDDERLYKVMEELQHETR